MSAEQLTLRPLLSRYPDARSATVPLLEPAFFPYLALVFGTPVAALASCYNAAALRRWGLVAASLALGAAGWLAFAVTFALVATSGAHSSLALIAARIVSFALGSLLFLAQRPHVRGHSFLLGSTIPLLNSYMAAFALSMILPHRVHLLLMSGGLLGR